MFKKIAIICLLSIGHITLASAADDSKHNVQCAPQLKNIVAIIQKLPEAQKLIADIQQEGKITITVNRSGVLEEFGAYWDPDNRQICVNISNDSSQGSLIGSIIFELHNASVNSKIDYFDNLARTGKIDREGYVRAIEYLEYQNSLNAAKLAQKGIDKGLFPSSSRLPTYKNFEEHYRYQKIGGHSQWIARTYDNLRANQF